MVVSVILAHPRRGSFNHAIAEACAGTLRQLGHDVRLHDLDAERFDPLLPADELPSDAQTPELIARHCLEIVEADGIVVVHPNWWGQPPAVLKGWTRSRPPRRRRLSVRRRGLGRRRAGGAPARAERGRVQHVEHVPGAGNDGLRRSPRGDLEELHLRPVRRDERGAAHVFGRGDEHCGAARSLARGGAKHRCASLPAGKVEGRGRRGSGRARAPGAPRAPPAHAARRQGRPRRRSRGSPASEVRSGRTRAPRGS